MIVEWLKIEWVKIALLILAYCIITGVFYFALRNKNGSDNE